MPDLDLLRTFVAVARAGGMTRASRELGLTQAAVSKRIQALEAAFHRPLFRRAGRTIEMTEAAQQLELQVGPLIDELLQAFESARRGEEELSGTLLLGGPADGLSELIIPGLAPLIASGLSPTCRFGGPSELVRALRDGELDLIMLSVRRRERGVELFPYRLEQFVLVGAPRWKQRVTSDGAVSVSDWPIACYDSDRRIVRRYWRDVFGLRSPTKLALIVPDLRALRRALLSGAVVSVLPDYLIRADVDRGDLIDLLPGQRPAPNQLYLAVRRSGPRSERAHKVARWLLERAG